MYLLRIPFSALWTLTLVFVITVTLANNTIFNDTNVPTRVMGVAVNTGVGVGLGEGGKRITVGYCAQGLEDIVDDEEYDTLRRLLPVTMPRYGRWVVFAADASPAQTSIAVPWRRKEQLSELDALYSPERTVCDAHPTFMRTPCHALITRFPYLYEVMQSLTYGVHSIYATYLYYRWAIDCGMLGWAYGGRK